MPAGQVPDSFLDVLDSRTFAFVATLGPSGEPQVNPVWHVARIRVERYTFQDWRNQETDPP